MPYTIKAAKGGGYDIVRTDTGKVVGHSDTIGKAKTSKRIREEHPPKGEKSSEPEGKGS